MMAVTADLIVVVLAPCPTFDLRGCLTAEQLKAMMKRQAKPDEGEPHG